jgi:hypothetical protein
MRFTPTKYSICQNILEVTKHKVLDLGRSITMRMTTTYKEKKFLFGELFRI